MIGVATENIYPIHDDIEIPAIIDEPQSASSSSDTSVIFGLVSACGGSGVTSVAIQMAYHAAQTQAKKVALLSLDFENSSLSHYLDLPPKVTTEHFSQSSDVMDQQNCVSWMSPSQYGFDALILPGSIDGNSRVNHNSVVHFLDLVATTYDIIILDIPKIWVPWTHAALGAANKTAFVTELNVPALRMTRERYSAFIKMITELSKPEIILNKYEKKTFNEGLSYADAQKIFPNIQMHTLSDNSRKIKDAANRGDPMGVTHKKLKTALQINSVFDMWLSSYQLDNESLRHCE